MIDLLGIVYDNTRKTTSNRQNKKSKSNYEFDAGFTGDRKKDRKNNKVEKDTEEER